MKRPSMGHVYLAGSDSKIWSQPNLEDMVTLAANSLEENFTTEFTVKLVQQYNRLAGRHIHVLLPTGSSPSALWYLCPTHTYSR